MYILGIETSCDETAAAVVQDGRKLFSSVVASQVEEHGLYGGVVPEIASRRHAEAISGVAKAALSKAGLSLGEIDAVAATFAPGLIGALLVGCGFAKSLAYTAGKPFVPVHHLRGHIAALYLAHPQLAPPFVCLVASGGHSHFVHVKDYTEFEVLGRTVDDAAGEAFDKVARTLGLGYPGGPALSKAAEQGNPKAYRLPTPHTENPMDVSFSGLKTAVLNLLNQAEMKGEPFSVPDIAASFQQKIVDILVERVLMAAKATGLSAIGLAGGVAANGLLRRQLEAACEKEGYRLFVPPLSLCGDNAAMIAAQGFYEYRAGHIGSLDQNAFATLPMEYNCVCNNKEEEL